jgi:hypothetical protein
MSTLGAAYHGRIVLPLRSTSSYASATLSSSAKWSHLPQSGYREVAISCDYFEDALSCRRDKQSERVMKLIFVMCKVSAKTEF